MTEDSARRRAKRAYKEQELVGGLYRVENTVTGWKSELLASVNLKGQRNKLSFAKNMGEPPSFIAQDVWSYQPREAFAFIEVEALKKQPDQELKAFREELDALLALYNEGENGNG